MQVNLLSTYMKRQVENQLTLDYFQSKRDNNRPDGCEDEYPCYMHTEQQAVDNSVLEINSSAGMIQGRFYVLKRRAKFTY